MNWQIALEQIWLTCRAPNQKGLQCNWSMRSIQMHQFLACMDLTFIIQQSLLYHYHSIRWRMSSGTTRQSYCLLFKYYSRIQMKLWRVGELWPLDYSIILRSYFVISLLYMMEFLEWSILINDRKLILRFLCILPCLDLQQLSMESLGFWIPPPVAIAHHLIRNWAMHDGPWFPNEIEDDAAENQVFKTVVIPKL